MLAQFSSSSSAAVLVASVNFTLEMFGGHHALLLSASNGIHGLHAESSFACIHYMQLPLLTSFHHCCSSQIILFCMQGLVY
jgi:hypothetical protein